MKKNANIEINYDKLVGLVKEKIPESLRNNPVKEKYIPKKFINLLTEGIYYFDKDSDNINWRIKEGMKYVPLIMYYIEKYKEHDILPDFFIYTFFWEFENSIRHYNLIKNINEIYGKACQTLNDNNYGFPHHSVTRLFPVYTNNSHELDFKDENDLADMIIGLFTNVFDNYDIYYLVLSKEDMDMEDEKIRNILSRHFDGTREAIQ